MINGVNTVDFNFAKDSKTNISNALPQGRSELIKVFQYAYTKPEITMSAKNLTKVKELITTEMETPGLERVHVQRLQTHAQLRNNKWTYQNFYNNAAVIDTVIDATHKCQYNRNNTNNNNNSSNNNSNKSIIENKSALDKCNKEEQLRYQQQQQQKVETVYTTPFVYTGEIDEPKRNFSDNVMLTSDKITTSDDDNRIVRPNYYRTEDQENAFRQIEDVHNYAKLKRYGHSNDSSDVSTRDEDEEEEDEDDDEDDGDDNNEVINLSTGLSHDFHKEIPKKNMMINSIKDHSSNGSHLLTQKFVSKKFMRTPSKSSSIEDNNAIVDVETVTVENERQLMQSTPAHHARRPMNAFLIFCKRHRAIVKDRYKSLENRAITKILGDWWASLDGDEKECFTKLAQQNKDAFFSAHPNFKWYKLPAPPLRTLSTRPTNAERILEENEYDVEETPGTLNKKPTTGSFFKLADETQMGELNSLINKKSKNECPLQKALGETTHFLSAHMPSDGDVGGLEINENDVNEKQIVKKRAITENSFSSNSSEDDVFPKKSSRSCKGKIYQELVSSGQIAPVAKKAKTAKTINTTTHFTTNELQAAGYAASMEFTTPQEGFNAASYLHAIDIRNNTTNKRALSESDVTKQYDEQVGQFDLEEKIKQLPALSLDAYLQRKRNIKKKKKFTTRKRHSNSVSLPITEHRPIILSNPQKEVSAIIQQQQQQQHQQRQQQAVGSQKRKARKESITRRDVSIIEHELTASLMPLTSNYELPSNTGCYYYNEKTITPNYTTITTATTSSTATNWQNIVSNPTTTTISIVNDAALSSNDLSSSRAYSNYADSITTTSDLFILAEVAAKRTELTN